MDRGEQHFETSAGNTATEWTTCPAFPDAHVPFVQQSATERIWCCFIETQLLAASWCRLFRAIRMQHVAYYEHTVIDYTTSARQRCQAPLLEKFATVVERSGLSEICLHCSCTLYVEQQCVDWLGNGNVWATVPCCRNCPTQNTFFTAGTPRKASVCCTCHIWRQTKCGHKMQF